MSIKNSFTFVSINRQKNCLIGEDHQQQVGKFAECRVLTRNACRHTQMPRPFSDPPLPDRLRFSFRVSCCAIVRFNGCRLRLIDTLIQLASLTSEIHFMTKHYPNLMLSEYERQVLCAAMPACVVQYVRIWKRRHTSYLTSGPHHTGTMQLHN